MTVMKRHTLVIAAAAAVAALTASCSDRVKTADIPVIDIAAHIGDDECDNISGRIKIVNLFRPEFTDSTMLTYPDIACKTDDRIYLYNYRTMFEFEYPSGRPVRVIDHRGNGPGEYTDIFGVIFDPDSSQWTVIDNENRLITYNADGSHLRTVTNDSIDYIFRSGNGNIIAAKNMFDRATMSINRDKVYYEYTPDMKLVGNYALKTKRWRYLGATYIDEVLPADGQIYINDGDTICRIDQAAGTLSPVIAINYGDYGTDWSELSTGEEVDAAKARYFYPFLPQFNSRYLFAVYGTEANHQIIDRYYDVYSITDGKLLFRQKATQESRKNGFANGVRLQIDGQEVAGWPRKLVEDDHFFILISADKMAAIAGTDEVNPVIAEVEITD